MSVADQIHAMVGSEIHDLRIAAGLSLDDVSVATGIPSADIDKLEHGVVTLHWRRIEDIIDAIGRPMTSFVDISDLPRTAS